MTTKAKTLTARDEARIHDLLLEVAVLPDGVTDVCMVVEGTLGERLPNGDFSGKGGTTKYGPAWVVRGRETTPAIALFDTQVEARYAFALLAGPESELGLRKEARRRRIAEAEAAEAAAEAEAKAAAKEAKRLERKGVNIAEATGGGSSRRARSSEKRTASTTMRMRVEEPMQSLSA